MSCALGKAHTYTRGLKFHPYLFFRFQMNVKSKLASHYSLRFHLGHENAWDLEDIVKVSSLLRDILTGPKDEILTYFLF